MTRLLSPPVAVHFLDCFVATGAPGSQLTGCCMIKDCLKQQPS
eukprot:CAMPEP_0183508858 /NCGR_PEP_ID=MMETSP0371-20130417/9174_1 /TAXON_ID=268820 /ORGANISM="Peridinium aciculiferum, Strain PAER-2" /LENGTH=42 /DNA_ID= /DNA_START= /DNA_END= /DNA_ORIENTATION=